MSPMMVMALRLKLSNVDQQVCITYSQWICHQILLQNIPEIAIPQPDETQ